MPSTHVPPALAQLIREAADLTDQWRRDRDDIRADLGLAPDQEPQDYSKLDDARRGFEAEAWGITEALATLLDHPELDLPDTQPPSPARESTGAAGPSRTVITRFADRQGWDGETVLDLLLRFIDDRELAPALAAHLRGVATWEAGQEEIPRPER